MRGVVTVAAAFTALLVSVPPAGAGSRPIGTAPSLAVSATPRAPGAHAVRLTLTFRYEMQCGYAGAGPLVVTFPAAVHLPQHFGSGAVRLAGKPRAARIKGHRVTVTVPPHEGILCNVMGPGSLTLAFTRAAKLENPARAGSYDVRARHGDRVFAARLAIKAPA